MRSKKPPEKKEVSFDNIVQSKNGACYTIHTSPEHFDAWCRIFKLRYWIDIGQKDEFDVCLVW